MENLEILNGNFITYTDDLFVVDVLGGVDLEQIERMVCTLRISYQSYPPYRTTIDLYNENQVDKLIRTLCDRWELRLGDVSPSINQLIRQLEEYKLGNLNYTKRNDQEFILSDDDRKIAHKLLKSKTLFKQLAFHLNNIGVVGEDLNAQIMFLAMASHKYDNPFSVIAQAKSGIGKSYILQKLSECLPQNSFSYHTNISDNALYYFDSNYINNKVLFVEDLNWTLKMLSPLATLQTQKKLTKTRATKDKDGMLHTTSFEVAGKLCLLACAYPPSKNYESLSLPFLMIHLNHSEEQDAIIMEYQKKVRAGLISEKQVQDSQHILKTLIASLDYKRVVNPFATLINLPKDVTHPRKSLLLLLDFIEIITYFFQHQRKEVVDEETGEVFIQTDPEDVKLAFELLKDSLFRKADELSIATRSFHQWLTKHLKDAKTKWFKATDIRKEKAIHPRTLNRYINELKDFSYVEVIGGNKHKGGYLYKITEFGNQTDVQSRIEQELKATMDKIYAKHKEMIENKTSKTVGQKAVSNTQKQATQEKDSRTTEKEKKEDKEIATQ